MPMIMEQPGPRSSEVLRGKRGRKFDSQKI